MYWTVWLALALFAGGEVGKRSRAAHGHPWAWPCSALGALLLVIHIVLAMAVRHGWSHAAAIASTASQTKAVFGIDWGGGLYVNYVFVAVWTAELLWWRLAPSRYELRRPALMWVSRVFYLIVIANAAVIFAAGWRRILGAAIVAALLVAWGRRD